MTPSVKTEGVFVSGAYMATDLAKYSDQSFNIIDNSSILEPSDFEKLANLKGELQETFLRTQIFRTRTEMEISVLNDLNFPTPDAKYWQSLREQNVMFSELVRLSYAYRKNIVKIKILQREFDEEQDELKKELKQIAIERRQFESREMERIAKDRIREIQQWHEIKERLTPLLAYSNKNVDEHQLLSYTHEFLNQAILMPPNVAQDVKTNLIGKLNTALKACKDAGFLEQIMSQIDHNTKQHLLNLGVKWQ
jgi:hypothetical protein